MAALHLSSRIRLPLVMCLAMLLSGAVMAAKHVSPLGQASMAASGVLAIILSLGLIWRGLRRCSAFYHPRRLPGGGLMNQQG
jgi:peptidoglycan biosynthesis protein MviN/MurJ (putative lipid II flippase)